MTQEEKQLLLKDLCARLPYNVIINCTEEDDERTNFDCFLASDMIKDIKSEAAYWIIKPYLRPMSSMTEEEQRTLDSMCNGVEMVSRLSGLKMFDKAFDWLYSKHLDIHGLIEKGLALEAPEDMYNSTNIA